MQEGNQNPPRTATVPLQRPPHPPHQYVHQPDTTVRKQLETAGRSGPRRHSRRWSSSTFDVQTGFLNTKPGQTRDIILSVALHFKPLGRSSSLIFPHVFPRLNIDQKVGGEHQSGALRSAFSVSPLPLWFSSQLNSLPTAEGSPCFGLTPSDQQLPLKKMKAAKRRRCRRR